MMNHSVTIEGSKKHRISQKRQNLGTCKLTFGREKIKFMIFNPHES